MKKITVTLRNKDEDIVIEGVYDNYFSGAYYIVKSVKDGIRNVNFFDLEYIVRINEERN